MKRILIAAASLVLAGVCRAAEPKTMETDWTYDVYYASTTSTQALTFDPANLGSGVGIATDPNSNVIGLSWTVKSVGGTSKFTISHTTRTYSSSAANAGSYTNPSVRAWYGNAPAISTSTVLMALDGDVVGGKFTAVTTNPKINLSTNGGTFHVWMAIGRRKS